MMHKIYKSVTSFYSPFVLWLMAALILMLNLMSRCAEEEVDAINSMGFRGQHYLEVTNSDSLQKYLNNDFTIEAWVAADTGLPNDQRAIIVVGNDNNGIELGLFQEPLDSSKVQLYVNEQSRGVFSIAGLDWRERRFHFLALTCANNLISFYFDGNLVHREVISDLEFDIGSAGLLIGAAYSAAGAISHYWIGNVDEVRLWSCQLTASEVAFHQRHPDKLTEHFSADGLDPLVGIWRFNAEHSGFVPDESGHGNDANIRGNSQSLYWDEFGSR